ncbi:MAG: domain S-box protein [Bacteroidetes bacterium]|nr:domain S-box protein [Bacteroidota bacterium]
MGPDGIQFKSVVDTTPAFYFKAMQAAIHTRSEEFDDLIHQAERLCDRRSADAQGIIDSVTSMAQSSRGTRQMILAEYIQAYYDCFINNNYENAIERLNRTLADIDDDEYSSFGYKLSMTLGNSYHFKGDIFSAQESYIKGLRCLDAKDHPTQSEEIFIASFNYNLSVLLSSSQLNIDGEENLAKAISLYQKHEKKFQLSKCYVAYAQLLDRRQEYRRSIEYLEQALAIDIENDDQYSIALSRANIGILLVKVNEYDRSFAYMRDALEYCEANNLTWPIAMIKFELGQAYLYRKETDKGLELVSAAEKMMINLDNKKELSEIYRVKSTVLSQQKDHEQANIYLEKYVESLKFFFDNEKTNALTRARKEFESEQKEKEAKLLREKNLQIEDYVHKLEVSNNELKQFAHVASHDLREPLRMITSYLQLMQRGLNGVLSEQQEEFFGFVMDGARRMDLLIQDLLRLAKVDANPVIEKVKLNNVLEEIKLNVDTLIRECGATLSIGELPVVLADRTQMLQLFQNLIANGIKYNKSATPEIRIKYIERADQLEIHVSDNGIGIPGHLREEVFQIFRRLQQQTNVAGSGIGLSICKKIVESMNGRIRVEDRPGGGTIFKIFLPTAILQPA